MNKSKILFLICISLCMFISACGSDTQSKENDDSISSYEETTDKNILDTTSNNDDVSMDETTYSIEDITYESENNVTESTDSTEDTVTQDDTTIKDESTSKQETTTKQETTSKQETTTKQEVTATKQEVTTTKQQETTSNKDLGNSQNKLDELMDKILSEIITPSMSELEKALAIHDYITYNIDYDYDDYLAGTIPYTSCNSLGVLETKWAVCEGYAVLFRDLAKASGLSVMYVVGTVNEKGTPEGHAWNQVKISGKWYNVDVTWDDPTYTGKPHQDNSMNGYAYFLITDEELKNNYHIWDSSKTNKCTSTISKNDLYNAMKATNKKSDYYYADNKEQLNDIIVEAYKKGLDSFELFMSADMDYHETHNYLTVLFSKNKTKYECTSGYSNMVNNYNVTINEKIHPILELSEIKDVMKYYTGSYEELRIRCYNEDFSKYELDDYNLGIIISYELACIGVNAKLCTYTEMTDNYTVFTLEPTEQADIVIDDFAELIELKDAVNNKTVWYSKASIDSTDMHKCVNEVTIPQGKLCYFATGRNDDYYGVTSFEMSHLVDVLYAENIEQVKAIGIERILTEELYMPIDNVLRSQVEEYIMEQTGQSYVSYGGHTEYDLFFVGMYFE